MLQRKLASINRSRVSNFRGNNNIVACMAFMEEAGISTERVINTTDRLRGKLTENEWQKSNEVLQDDNPARKMSTLVTAGMISKLHKGGFGFWLCLLALV